MKKYKNHFLLFVSLNIRPAGVLPLQVVCHDYVWSCREQSFNDLARQMKVLKLDTQSAPQNVVIMWLLETDQVPTGCKDPVSFN
jgi:hypothetical protein